MRKLTVGMRCRIKPSTEGFSCYAHYDVLLVERFTNTYACLVLGQLELKKEAPLRVVVDEIAWVDESELDFVDADFETNLDFIDWYHEHLDEDFCGDCL